MKQMKESRSAKTQQIQPSRKQGQSVLSPVDSLQNHFKSLQNLLLINELQSSQ